MLKRQLLIQNKLGLHARAAAKLVTLANRFQANISLSTGKMTAHTKSIMGLMMLSATCGTSIELTADNAPDSEKAMEAIEALIQNRFDEPE
jgi:phosphocarrier protein HPr